MDGAVRVVVNRDLGRMLGNGELWEGLRPHVEPGMWWARRHVRVYL